MLLCCFVQLQPVLPEGRFEADPEPVQMHGNTCKLQENYDITPG